MTSQAAQPRGVDVAALAARLVAKATDVANAPARRRRNGHIADCPNPGRPVDSCGVCRSEIVGRAGDGDEPDDR